MKYLIGAILVGLILGLLFTIQNTDVAINQASPTLLSRLVIGDKIVRAPTYRNIETRKAYIRRAILNGEIPEFTVGADLAEISAIYLEIYNELDTGSTEPNLWKNIRTSARAKGLTVKNIKYGR